MAVIRSGCHMARLPFLQEALQQECEEIGECVELPVPTDVLIAEFDAVLHIRIGIPLDKVVQRGGGVILGLDLYGYQSVGIANKEIHFKGRILALVEIQLLITRLPQHLSNNILIDSTLVGAKILVGTQVLLSFLIQRSDKQARVAIVELISIITFSVANISKKSHFWNRFQ